MALDSRAATGFAHAAGLYERGRPSYAPAAIAVARGALGLTSSSRILDLAAGTGKLTRLLARRVGAVTAVEPSRAMRSILRGLLPEVEVLDGYAEAIPLGDGAVDAVFVGEAFHWFDVERAAAEIARVLRRGAGLALLWNHARWAPEEHPWIDRFDELVAPYREAAGPMPAGEGAWRDRLEATGRFEPLSSAGYDHLHPVRGDDFVALVASWSWIANLDPAERRGVLAEVRELTGGGRLALRYRTELHWTRHRD
jgi:SAM-dependent methyltransferase